LSSCSTSEEEVLRVIVSCETTKKIVVSDTTTGLLNEVSGGHTGSLG